MALSNRRAPTTSRSAVPIPSCCHSPSSSHAPPAGRESVIVSPPPGQDGSTVRYLSIPHNDRGPGGPSVAKVLLPLGREDRLDVAGLRRLVGSINRYLGE